MSGERSFRVPGRVESCFPGMESFLFRTFTILRGVIYSAAFVWLWTWLAVSVRPFDAQLGNGCIERSFRTLKGICRDRLSKFARPQVVWQNHFALHASRGCCSASTFWPFGAA